MFQRTYELSPSGGRLELLIREPNVHDRHPAACTFQIIADGELWKEFTAYGVDKLQSLQLALRLTRTLLPTLEIPRNKFSGTVRTTGT